MENVLPAQHVPHLFDCHPEKQREFMSLWTDYHRDHGAPADPMRVLHLWNLIEAANALAPGDYIELGVHRGLTLRVIHRLMDQSRTLYGLDTFIGFDPRDVAEERRLYADNKTCYDFAPTSVEYVGRYVGNGAAPANLRLIEGWFPESFAPIANRQWRFAHIDFDLYEPAKQAMQRLWSRLVPGGIMIVHDYGCLGFPGIKIAVDEFASEAGPSPVQLSDTWGSVVFRKPMRIAASRSWSFATSLLKVPSLWEKSMRRLRQRAVD